MSTVGEFVNYCLKSKEEESLNEVLNTLSVKQVDYVRKFLNVSVYLNIPRDELPAFLMTTCYICTQDQDFNEEFDYINNHLTSLFTIYDSKLDSNDLKHLDNIGGINFISLMDTIATDLARIKQGWPGLDKIRSVHNQIIQNIKERIEKQDL